MRLKVRCKISRNVKNLGIFFEKIDGFLENLNFFNIAKGGKFAVECVSNGFIS